MCDVIARLHGPISHRPIVAPERVTGDPVVDPITVPLPQFRFDTHGSATFVPIVL